MGFAPSAQQGSAKVGAATFALAGVAAAVASAASLYAMFLHLKNYRRPDLQRLTIRIFWMVPVYAIASFISLSSKNVSDYIDTIRDVYEAFVIYSFFTLLVNYLGGERALLSLLQERLRTHHLWPFHYCFAPMDMSDPDTFLFVRRGVLQFVILKPILAIFIMILKVSGHYEEGYVAWDSPYLYISLAYNLSVCWSMYCLLLFYHQCSRDLKPYRPIPKFICVKAIIFLTFWQGLTLAFLVAWGVIRNKGEEYSANNIALALQDVIICFEMPFFAWYHFYAFPWTDYDDSRLSSRLTLPYALRDALGVRDIAYDTYATFIDPPDFNMPRRRGPRRYNEHYNTNYWSEDDDAQDDYFDRDIERLGDSSTNRALLANQRSRESSMDRRLDHVASASLERTYIGHSGQNRRLYLNPDDDHSLFGRTRIDFDDPNDEEENDYAQARELVFGDYNFPVVNEDPRYHNPPAVRTILQQHASSFVDRVATKTREHQARLAAEAAAKVAAAASARRRGSSDNDDDDLIVFPREGTGPIKVNRSPRNTPKSQRHVSSAVPITLHRPTALQNTSMPRAVSSGSVGLSGLSGSSSVSGSVGDTDIGIDKGKARADSSKP